MNWHILSSDFFDRDAQIVAQALLGKVLAHQVGDLWLQARIVETEAYYLQDRASHASLGYTPKRKSLFMPPGTIYMYYARGGDSFNISTQGAGNAVLVKGAMPYQPLAEEDAEPPDELERGLAAMAANNPLPGGRPRPLHRLCAGQTLLCRALGLKVPHWDGLPLPQPTLLFRDTGYTPRHILCTTRLGIPSGRDGHLPYRFVDADFTQSATKAPSPRSLHKSTMTPLP